MCVLVSIALNGPIGVGWGSVDVLVSRPAPILRLPTATRLQACSPPWLNLAQKHGTELVESGRGIIDDGENRLRLVGLEVERDDASLVGAALQRAAMLPAFLYVDAFLSAPRAGRRSRSMFFAA